MVTSEGMDVLGGVLGGAVRRACVCVMVSPQLETR